jgi:hypothetical protein
MRDHPRLFGQCTCFDPVAFGWETLPHADDPADAAPDLDQRRLDELPEWAIVTEEIEAALRETAAGGAGIVARCGHFASVDPRDCPMCAAEQTLPFLPSEGGAL